MLDRITHAERLANSCPRAFEPDFRDDDHTAEAKIVLDEIQTDFGICQALVTIEGRPEDWSIISIEVPTDVHAFSRYAAANSPMWFREDWEQVNERGSWIERELWRAAKAEITEDMATDALAREMGEWR